jgi:DNA polymerase-3 subunit gamma/tau
MTLNLARRYRPQTFDEMVGQKHIRPILKRLVVNQEKLPPVLLFAGTRGTGKTTAARIIAKALNCTPEPPLDPNANRPCNECPSCLAVTIGNSLDVLEVDAASNGGVAEIRKIKDMVGYAVGGQWRVVLLDEAHSMSKEAFNALLKVLEEPPPQTLFVLLTTEPGKIIDTIVSRSMSFDFRRVTVADIVERLKFIAANENIQVT